MFSSMNLPSRSISKENIRFESRDTHIIKNEEKQKSENLFTDLKSKIYVKEEAVKSNQYQQKTINLEKRKRSEKIIEKEMSEHVRICSFPDNMPLSSFTDFINPPLREITEKRVPLSMYEIKEVVNNY